MVSTSLNALHKKHFSRTEFSRVQVVHRLVQDSRSHVFIDRVKARGLGESQEPHQRGEPQPGEVGGRCGWTSSVTRGELGGGRGERKHQGQVRKGIGCVLSPPEMPAPSFHICAPRFPQSSPCPPFRVLPIRFLGTWFPVRRTHSVKFLPH